MQKALREAKIHSSWINPNRPYEEALDRFICASLEQSPENRFLREFTAFLDSIKTAGIWNSLAQTLLKITSPGVPDFYQGTEIWDFTLVDPDNRRPVDYRLRCELLNRLRQDEAHGPLPLIDHLLQDPSDGAIKLYLISRALCFRKSNQDLFAHGSYVPLRAGGRRQNHVVAFARVFGHRSAIVVASRFFMSLSPNPAKPIGEEVWEDSKLLLRRHFKPTAYRDVFTQSVIETGRNGKMTLPLSRIFAHLPIALLESID